MSLSRSRLTLVAVPAVVIIVVLGGAYAYLTTTSLQSQLSSETSSFSSLQSQLSSLQSILSNANAIQLQELSQVSSLQSLLAAESSQYSTISGQVSSLRAQTSNLSTIAGIHAQVNLWTQRTVYIASDSCNKTTFTNLSYAGYLEVDFFSSSTTGLTVGISWSADGVSYSSNASPTIPGTSYFVILPSNQVTVSLCNSNFVTPNSVIVSLVYHY